MSRHMAITTISWRAILILQLPLLLAAGAGLMGCVHGKGAHTPFSQGIPPVAPESDKGILDACDWKNAYLGICPDGFMGWGHSRRTSPEELACHPALLPHEACPYGRIVAVREIGILSGDDDRLIQAVLENVLAILSELDVEVSRWPSA